MKTKLLLVLSLTCVGQAFSQQITTPSGSPLVIGNNGLRLSGLNSSSTPQASNGVSLSVNGNGDIILVPAGGSSSSLWQTSGSNVVSPGTAKVGIGVASPAYKLDIDGDLNLSASSRIRLGGASMFRLSNSSFLIGENAGGASELNASAVDNVFLGKSSGSGISTGKENVFLGNFAGASNSTGIRNMYIGFRAGVASTTASNNMFIGAYAGNVNTTGASNSFIGSGAGASNTTGFHNTYIGDISGFYNNGYGNVTIGQDAGNTVPGAYTTMNTSTFIGYRSKPGGANAATLVNATAIGADATVTASNSLVLGNAVNVGIGVSAPTARLEVKSGTSGSSGLKFTDLTSGATGTIVTATRFLTVDANGNVVLGSTTGGREAASFAENWKLDAATKSLSNSNDGAVVIGQNLLKLPGSYRLFVQEGILTERVKVALRGTDDWSDKVFEPSYKLRSLNEVEQFIKENNHLPGVPSAKDMVKSGNDLHKTDAVLLEKIEELTLYMLELKKENEKLRKEVDQLKQSQQR